MPQKAGGLNERQREAADHSDGPLLIVAGAGSGKTKTLTSRLIKLLERGVPPPNIIAITFTNKAAKEMADRLPKTGCFIGTFHSLGAKILRDEGQFFRRTPAFTIFDNDDSLSLIKKIMKGLNLDKERYSPVKIQSKISSVKNELVEPAEILDVASRKVFDAYESALIASNAFDFDDLIEKVVRVFESQPDILKKYQDKFRHILVDEYQDVNTAQYQFIKFLAEKHQNLSVVGDDAQSIYRFRGSDFRNFLNFENDWANAKVIKLEQNYRSTANIITAASQVIKNNKLQKTKELWTENPHGELIKVVRAADAEEEAEWVADEIQNSETAILYRTNAQSRAIEQALIASNIPYKIFGGLKFYERKEIKDIVAALRLAANPRDAVSAERLEKTFPKDISAYLKTELPRLAQELTPIQLINFFLENSRYLDYLDRKFPNANERVENIKELIVFTADFPKLTEFLERVSLLQSSDAPNNSPNAKISLMTIHLAKGLEFDRVFLIGCSEGLLPHQMSYGSLEELEEERRLIYVAMTRAKKDLSLSFHGLPSRFLYEIPPELTDFKDLAGNHGELPDEEEIYID